MPTINIIEDDLTRATGTSGTDIVFIPGFTRGVYSKVDTTNGIESGVTYYTYDGTSYVACSGLAAFTPGVTYYKNTTEYEIPVLCESVSQFEAIFGSDAPTFTVTDSTYNTGIRQGDVDRSYVMAKELLSRGLPVYYYALRTGVSTSPINQIDTITFSGITIKGPAISFEVPSTWSGAETDILTFTVALKNPYNDTLGYTVKSNNDRITLTAAGMTSNAEDATLTLKLEEFTEDDRETTITFIPEIIYGTAASTAVDISTFYTKMGQFFSSSELEDKGEYSIKYITSGGYHNFNPTGSNDHIINSMIRIASNRGDAIALLEGVNNKADGLTDNNSLFVTLNNANISDGEYAAAFFPWATYSVTHKYESQVADVTKTVKSISLPACYGYLSTLARVITTSPNWLAIAGTTRGIVPNIISLEPNNRVSNVIADQYQPTKAGNLGTNTIKVALNTITDIKPYGLTIWGNRTLKSIAPEGLEATNFLNTRNMISDIKKVAYRAAKANMFEQNNENLWIKFKSEVSPFLEQLKMGNGISDYKLIKSTTHYAGGSLGKEEFACAIKIYPLYAVESFEIAIVISDNDVAVG